MVNVVLTFFFSVVTIFDLMHDMETIPASLNANSICKSSMNDPDETAKCSFPGHHSYFRKNFLLLLAVNIGHVISPHRTLQ